MTSLAKAVKLVLQQRQAFWAIRLWASIIVYGYRDENIDTSSTRERWLKWECVVRVGALVWETEYGCERRIKSQDVVHFYQGMSKYR
jgi:hypothetical protein